MRRRTRLLVIVASAPILIVGFAVLLIAVRVLPNFPVFGSPLFNFPPDPLAWVPAPSSYGVVVYSDGNFIRHISGGTTVRYAGFDGDMLGVEVHSGDVIETEANTFVEIQVFPSRNMIKIAERTTFKVMSLSHDGNGIFTISQGRLRGRVEGRRGQSPFEFHGIGVAAGVRGTDFGVDVEVSGEGEATTRVYCFEGQVEASVQRDSGRQEAVFLNEGEMLTASGQVVTGDLRATGAHARIAMTTLETSNVSESVAGYWRVAQFAARPREAEELLEQFPSLRGRYGVGVAMDTGDVPVDADEVGLDASYPEASYADPASYDPGDGSTGDYVADDAAGTSDAAGPAEGDPPVRLPEEWPPVALPALRELQPTPGIVITDRAIIETGTIGVTDGDIARLVDRIAQDNGYASDSTDESDLPSTDYIRAGQSLVLPDSSPYVVRSGDTIWGVAAQYATARLKSDYQLFDRHRTELGVEDLSHARKQDIIEQLRQIGADTPIEGLSRAIGETLAALEQR